METGYLIQEERNKKFLCFPEEVIDFSSEEREEVHTMHNDDEKAVV